MAFVSKVSEADAGPEVKPLYQQIREYYSGFVPNYFQALGHWPQVIERQMALAGVVLGDGTLTTALKEQILRW